MSTTTEKHWTKAEGYAEAKGRDDYRSAWSCVPLQSAEMGLRSVHHRMLRSRGGTHAPSNLVCLLGSGTTQEHEWVHKHDRLARVLGYTVHSWENPAQVPIFRFAPFGPGLGWYLQDDDAQLHPVPPPAADHDPDELADAMITFDRIYLDSRRRANPYRL